MGEIYLVLQSSGGSSGWIWSIEADLRGKSILSSNINGPQYFLSTKKYCGLFIYFFARKFSIYSSLIMTVQRIPEIIKITSRFVDHLATTTNTETSRRCASVITPPSLESDTTCCSRQSGSCRAKARWTSAPEQQPLQMKNNVDQKNPIRRHTNIDKQRQGSSKSTKDRSAGDTPPHTHQRC